MVISKFSKIRRSRIIAFSLVELLVTFVIIGILGTITTTIFQNVTDKARLSESKTLHAALENGLELYKNDYGDYPLPLDNEDGEEGSKALYQAMTGDGIDKINVGDSFDIPELCKNNTKSTKQFSKCGKVYVEGLARDVERYYIQDEKDKSIIIVNSFDNTIHYSKDQTNNSEEKKVGERNYDDSYHLWSKAGKIILKNW